MHFALFVHFCFFVQRAQSRFLCTFALSPFRGKCKVQNEWGQLSSTRKFLRVLSFTFSTRKFLRARVNRMVKLDGDKPKKSKGLRRGEHHPKAKLTDHEVELVRSLRSEGLSFAKIALKMEMGKTTVIDICAYRTRYRSDEW